MIVFLGTNGGSTGTRTDCTITAKYLIQLHEA